MLLFVAHCCRVTQFVVCTVNGVECMSFITFLLLKVFDIPIYYRHVDSFSLFLFLFFFSQREKEFCESLQEITGNWNLTNKNLSSVYLGHPLLPYFHLPHSH